MDTEIILPVVFRWLHILAAVIAVGGLFFLRFVLHPASLTLGDEERDRLREEVRARWSRVVMICIMLLLVSGFYQFFVIGLPKGREHASYSMLFGIKFLAALGVFFLASALSGRSPALAPLRQRARFWLTISAWLALVIILISGYLKNLV